jgi:hypothetical protein
MGMKAKLDLTPEQRAVMARMQERLRKSALQTEEERERLRLVGERLKLRKPDTEPPQPQEPTPQRGKRRRGGGRKPLFDEQRKTWLQKKYSRDLKKDQRLAKHDAAVPHVKQLAKDKYGIAAGRNTLLDQIIRPVLRCQPKIKASNQK